MKNLKMLWSAILLVLGVQPSAQAQISYGPAGTALYDFAALPTVADGWSTLSVAGATADITTEAGLDAVVNALAVSGITTALGATATTPPAANAIARFNSTLGALQTCPTGNKATVLMATVRNDSGGNVSAITLSYDYANPGVAAGEQVPGIYAYYSLTGAAGSWTKIPELSGANFGAKSVVVSLVGGPWVSGANLYVLWADDNGTPSPDAGYTIDNFQVGSGAVTPPSIVTQPASTNAPERSVVVLGVGATGTSLTYQWYKGSLASPTIIPGATATSLRVTNMTGLARYPWSTPLDNGGYFVRVSGASGSPVDSSVATVTITPDTTKPALSYATCGTSTNEQVVLSFSEPLSNLGGEVTDASNWEIRSLDNATTLGIINIAYTDNGASTAVTFDIDPATPRDPTKGYKLSLVGNSFVTDTAATGNSLVDPLSTPILCFTNILLNQTAAWKLNDKDVDPTDQLPVTWKDVVYNDSAAPWATGVGPFDAKRNNTNTLGAVNCRDVGVTNFGAIGTCLNLTSPVNGTNLVTAYFRSHFNHSGSPSGSVFLISGKFDDGVVMYLNGTEIWRLGVAAGVVTNGTFASRTVNDGDADDSVLLVSPTSMVSGNNLLAFSLHQVNLTSSDLYARINVAELLAEPPGQMPVIVTPPASRTNDPGSTAVFSVVATGSTPLSYQWWRDGLPVAGAIGSSLTLTNVQSALIGDYSVVVTNAQGAVTSSVARLSMPGVDADLWRGLIAYYPLDGSPQDQSLYGNHAVPQGDPGYGLDRDGLAGRAVLLNGTNQWLQAPHQDYLNGYPMTVSAWFRTSRLKVDTAIVGKYWAASWTGWNLTFGYYYTTNGSALIPWYLNGYINGYIGQWGEAPFNTPALTDGLWHHVLFSVDTNGAFIMLDGVQASTALPRGTLSRTTTLEPLRIGLYGGAAPSELPFFQGLIDEVRIYNRALTTNEAARLFAAEVTAPTITAQPVNVGVAVGATANFAVTVTGTAPLYYQWRRNGVALPGATNSALVLPNVQTNQAGSYDVVVANAVGSATSTAAVLTVIPPPAPIQEVWSITNRTPTESTIATIDDASRRVFLQSVLAGTAVFSCIDLRTGQVLWETNVVGGNRSGAAALPNGTVVYGSDALPNGYVSCHNIQTGRLLWQINPGGAPSAVGFTPAGIMHFATVGNHLGGANQYFGINSNGSQIWKVSAPVQSRTSPVILTNGTLVYGGGSFNNSITAVNAANGSTLWSFNTGGEAVYEPSLGLSNRIYATSRSGKVFALNGATGAKLWEASIGTEPGLPIIDGQGRVYVGVRGGAVFSLDGTTGATLWQTNLGFSTDSSLLMLDSEGVIWCGDIGANLPQLVGLNAANGAVRYRQTVAFPIGGLTMSSDGLIIAKTSKGCVAYRVEGTRRVATDAPWPAWRHDAAGSSYQGYAIPAPFAAPFVVQQPTNQAVAAGATISFAVTAGGTAPLAYQWRRDGAALPGATNGTLVLANVQSSQVGPYDVTITNAYGSVTSVVAYLTVTNAALGYQALANLPSINLMQAGLDDLRRTYVLGSYTGTLSVATSTFVSRGARDLVLLRYSSAGTLDWAVTLGSIYDEGYAGFAIRGNTLVLAGNQPQSIRLVDTAGVTHDTLYDAGNKVTGNDAFLFYLDLAGRVQWKAAVTSASAGEVTGQGPGIAVDQSGNVLWAGVFNGCCPAVGSATITPATGSPVSITSPSYGTGFLIKFSSTGAYLWSAKCYNRDASFDGGLATASDGSVVVAGRSRSWSSGTPTTLIDAAGNSRQVPNPAFNSTFVAKLDANGVYQWSVYSGGSPDASSYSYLAGVEVDVRGDIYAYGSYSTVGLAHTGSDGVAQALPLPAGWDTFLLKLNAAGVISWVRPMGGPGDDFLGDGSITAAGNILLGGTMASGLTIPTNLPAIGSGDGYVLLLDTNGNLVTASGFGGPGVDNTASAVGGSTGLDLVAGQQGGGFLAFGVSLTNPGPYVIVAQSAASLAPQISAPPTNLTVTVGQSATFSVVASGAAPLSYLWLLNGASIASATNSSYSLASATLGNAGSYRVVVSNSYGTVTSAVATLTVLRATPVISAAPSGTAITYGQTLAASTLSGGTASVPGAFAYLTPNLAPNAGSTNVAVVFTPVDTNNYTTASTNITVVVNKANAVVSLGNLSRTYDGSAQCATYSTTPSGLAAVLTYNGSTNCPVAPGSYTVVGIIDNPNYAGAATNTLTITDPAGGGFGGWLYQRQITLSNLGNPSALTNIPFRVVIDTASAVAAGRMNAGGNDLRFVDAALRELPHWIQSGMNSTSTVLWVRVDQVPANAVKDVYLLYGNSSATNTSSGQRTFDLFDDFSGGLSQWTVRGGASAQVVGGKLSLSVSTPDVYVTLTSTQKFGPGFAVHFTESNPSGGRYHFSKGFGDNTDRGRLDGGYYPPNSITIAYNHDATTAGFVGSTNDVEGGFSIPYSAASKEVECHYEPGLASIYVDRGFVFSMSTNIPTIPLSAFLWLNGWDGDPTTWLVDDLFVRKLPNTAVPLTVSTEASRAGLPSILGQPQSVTNLVSSTATFTVTANGTAPLRYQWQKNGLDISGATNAVLGITNVEYANVGNYRVIVTNTLGSVTSSVATLTLIKGTPNVSTLPTGSPITYGQTLAASTLTGGSVSVPGSFAYVTPSLAPTAGSTNVAVVFRPLDTNNYTSVTTNITLLVNKAAATVTLANLGQTYNGTPKCATATTAPAGLAVTLTYGGSTNCPSDAGSYPVLGTVVDANYAGSATNTLVITGTPPVVVQQPLSRTNQAGTLASFSVTASGPGTLTYQWRRGGTNVAAGTGVAGVTASTLWLTNVQPSQAGSYSVVVGNAYGSVTSAVAVLTVTGPPVITAQPQSATNGLGGTATFSVTANGAAPLTYQWRKNGLALPGATNALLTLANLRAVAVGAYQVVVANGLGSATSAVATLTLNGVNSGEWAGLVAYYPFNGNANDESGFNNHGTINGAWLDADRYGQTARACLVAGTNTSYVQLPDSPAFQATDYTVSLWFQALRWPSSTNGTAMLLSKGPNNFELQVGSPLNLPNGVSGLRFWPRQIPGGGAQYWDAPSGSFVTNDWNHLVATFSPLANQVRLYLNGRQLTLTGTGSVTNGPDLAGPARLGARVGGAADTAFLGRLDDVRIYNRALTAVEARQVYQSESPDTDGDGLADAQEQGFSRYQIVAGQMTWLQAKADAEARGGHLATVTSQAEWDSILAVLGPQALYAFGNGVVWLGASDAEVEGQWRWVTGERWNYTRWYPGEPSQQFGGGNEDYLLTWWDNPEDGQPGWNDGDGPPVNGFQGYLLEYGYYTDPRNPDTDSDGFGDGDELAAGTSPVDASSVPPNRFSQFVLVANTPGGGVVVPNPLLSGYPSNRLVTVTATPAAGWSFMGWQGDAVGDNPLQNLTMSRSRCVQGVFGTPLVRTVIGSGSVRVVPEAATYPYGTVVNLVAEPAPGNYFVRWTNAVVGPQNPRTYTTVSANPLLTARFAPLDPGNYALTVIPEGAGTVSTTPATNQYPSGTLVRIFAQPATGQAFVGWTGDASGTANPLTVTMDRSRVVTAVFTRSVSMEVVSCVGRVAPGSFRIAVSGRLGDRYEVQLSPDMSAWAPWAVVTNTLGSAQWTDPTAGSDAGRYYRVLLVP